MLLGNGEGKFIIAKDVFWIEALEVDELGAEVVDDGAEAQPAPPAGGHVEDVDVGVPLRHPLAPRLQGFRALHCHLSWSCNNPVERRGPRRWSRKGTKKKEFVAGGRCERGVS